MRKLKFRVIKKDLNMDIYGEGRTIFNIGIEDIQAFKNNPDYYIFREYTGLKDKNGIEIYEGDIVKWKFGVIRQEPVVVKFNEDTLQFALWNEEYFTTYDRKLYEQGKNTNSIEVIGNIYMNKELL